MARTACDYAARYERLVAPLRRHPWSVGLLRRANSLLTAVFYLAYGALAVYVALHNPWGLLVLAAIPAAAFAALSLYRTRRDAPRPYEVCAIEPLIERDGSGRSFPSRHSFSAFAIASSWAAVSWPVAAVLLVCACGVAAARVLGGVHFPRDVAAGGAWGLLAGMATAFALGLL